MIVQAAQCIDPGLALQQVCLPDRKTGLRLLSGQHHAVQLGGDTLAQLLDGCVVLVGVCDQAGGQSEQFEQRGKRGPRQSLGPLDELPVGQGLDANLDRLIQVAGIDLDPRQGQGDLAGVDQSQEDHSDPFWL